jgi:phosphonoacetaldehyde dehydrogenase
MQPIHSRDIEPRREAMRIAGRRIDGDIDARIEVRYPYDGTLVGSVPRASAEQVARAFRIAAEYRPRLTRHERRRILLRTAELLAAGRDEISALITLETGLCKRDTRHEVDRACDVFALAGHLCTLDDGEIYACDVTARGRQRRIFTQREPLTAISAITPFNHPLNLVAHKVAPSIATNNCMVLKPAEATPLTALLLADLLYEAGLPPAMFSVVTGLPADIGREMIQNRHAELITFTGSVAVGKHIAATAGYRRLVLELGGNEPLIVMADADLDRAAALAVAGATANSGQRCTAIKRVLCEEAVADAFAERVVEQTGRLCCGDPMAPGTDVGTVISEQAAAEIQGRVQDALARGARLLYGNVRRGALYSPTVLDHVPLDCTLVCEETFGPAIPIIRVAGIDDAIRVANASGFGLAAGVCTDRYDHIQRFCAELETGAVNIWELPGYRTEMSPFGGIKDSGLGHKEGVAESMRSFTNVKTVSLPWG